MKYSIKNMAEFLTDASGTSISPGDVIVYSSRFKNAKSSRLIRARVMEINTKMVLNRSEKTQSTIEVNLKVLPLSSYNCLPRQPYLTIRNLKNVIVVSNEDNCF
jgi:hypothetical protein